MPNITTSFIFRLGRKDSLSWYFHLFEWLPAEKQVVKLWLRHCRSYWQVLRWFDNDAADKWAIMAKTRTTRRWQQHNPSIRTSWRIRSRVQHTVHVLTNLAHDQFSPQVNNFWTFSIVGNVWASQETKSNTLNTCVAFKMQQGPIGTFILSANHRVASTKPVSMSARSRNTDWGFQIKLSYFVMWSYRCW